MKPSLSVLITYHNEKTLLTECLESLFQGSSLPDEILVYDDASHFPASNYVRPEWKVRIIREEDNRGPGYGRNRLAQEASSDFIHFHDSDDLFTPTWCESIRAALSFEHQMVLSEVSSFKESDPQRELNRNVVSLNALSKHGDMVRFLIFHNLLIPAMTVSRSSFLATGGFDHSLARAEDFEWFLRNALKRPKFFIVKDASVIIRIRAVSRSSNVAEEYLSGAKILLRYKNEIPRSYHPLCATRCLKLARFIFQMGRPDMAKEVVEVSRAFGKPDYQRLDLLFGLAYRGLGFMNASRLASFYHQLKSHRASTKKRQAS